MFPAPKCIRVWFRKTERVLQVIHYSDDHSWAFLCGTTNDMSDVMSVSMEQVVSKDKTLFDARNVEPGWMAIREDVGGEWQKIQDDDL